MQKCVAVLGGGVGGLSTSYYLSRCPQVSKVVLLEGSNRYGGWMNSTRREDGAVFEHGPRGVRPAGAAGKNTLNMLCDLGLEREILPVPRDHVASQNRFLYVGGQLHMMPSGPSGVLKTTPPFSSPILLSVLKEVLVSRKKQEDESLHSFFSRRLGSELADVAVDALCRGVFAGDSKQLSVRSCFPMLYRAEQEWSSIVLGMLLGGDKGPSLGTSALAQRARRESWAQWSLVRGMQTLADALQETLRSKDHVEMHSSASICNLKHTATGWEITLRDGAILKADHVISALPASVLATILPPAAQTLTEQLCCIGSVCVGLVNLEFEGSVLPVKGFGHLIPSSEDRGILGIVYDSVPFPQHNRPGEPTTRLTVMMGGAWFEEVFGPADEVEEQVLLQRAVNAVRSHLGVTSSPMWSRTAVLKNCIPQYHVGHWKNLEIMRRYITEHELPLTLTGASYDGVAVNDVILSGRRAAEGIVGNL